eukprot:12558667-Alexandrium_andersonii.AAC.1
MQRRHLSGEQLEALTGIINECRRTQVFPRQLYLNNIALLGKPAGGERPIALLPFLARVVARIDRADYV